MVLNSSAKKLDLESNLDLSVFGVMIRFVERVLLFVMPEKM